MTADPGHSKGWYVRTDHGPLGPISAAALRSAAAAGKIRPDTLVRQGSTENWIAAARVKGLFQPPALPHPSNAEARPRVAEKNSNVADVGAVLSNPPASGIAERYGDALRQSLRSDSCRTCPFCQKSMPGLYCTDCRRLVFEPALWKWGIPLVVVPLLIVLGSTRPWDAMTDHPDWLTGPSEYSVSRWILYGIAGLFAVAWFFYYYGKKTAALAWNAAAPIVRPAFVPIRLLAAPAMKTARVLQTPLTVRRARGLLCECESCQTRYVIGTNAVVVTFQQALAHFQGTGSMFVLGGSVSSVPDTIGLIVGKASWPAGSRICPDRTLVTDEVAAAWCAGERREWQCDRCKCVQEYRWPM